MSREQKNNERKKEIIKSRKRCKIVIMCISLTMLLIALFVIVIVRHRIKINTEIMARLENENASSKLVEVHTEWGKTIEGDHTNNITCITEIEDGGIIVGGYFYSESIDLGNGVVLTNKSINTSMYDGMIIKYNTSGNVEWGKSVGGEYKDWIYCMTETKDGGYIIGGSFASSSIDLGNGVVLRNTSLLNVSLDYTDGMIIKYDASGNVEWGKSVGGDGSEQINCIIETKDGGYIVGGNSESNVDLGNGIVLKNNGTSSSDGIIIKYNTSGNVEWGKSVGGGYDDDIKCIIETKDGGYIVGGIFGSNSIDLGNGLVLRNKNSNTAIVAMKDIMILKYDSKGNLELGKAIGGQGDENIGFIIGTSDGGYVIGVSFRK